MTKKILAWTVILSLFSCSLCFSSDDVSITFSIQQLINPIKTPSLFSKLFLKKSNIKSNSDSKKLSYVSYSRLKRNEDQIKTLAIQANSTEKNSLYKNNEMEKFRPILWSILPGLGIGNFMQSDYLYGSLFCAVDIACYAFCFRGLIDCPAQNDTESYDDAGLGMLCLIGYILSPPLMLIIDFFVSVANETPLALMQGAVGAIVSSIDWDKFAPIGIACLTTKLISSALQITRICIRAKKYNTTLKEALLLTPSSEEKISFAPIINSYDKEYGIALRMCL